jgi:hypothetical protein
MKRRSFITLLGGAAAAWPLGARAQQGERMRRIGVLMPHVQNNPVAQARIAALSQELQQLGWSVGRNLAIDVRFAGPYAAGIRKQAAEESRRGKRTILGIEIRGVLDQPRRKWDARATSGQCNVTVSICALAASAIASSRVPETTSGKPSSSCRTKTRCPGGSIGAAAQRNPTYSDRISFT